MLLLVRGPIVGVGRRMRGSYPAAALAAAALDGRRKKRLRFRSALLG
jgi:hypothetical protein